MTKFEYKIVPAPKKGLKGKGVKGPESRFANALMSVMNELGAQGWEYQRSDTLPSEERSGFRGRTTTFQNMLVFRRKIVAVEELDIQPPVETTPVEPVAAASPAPVAVAAIAQTHTPFLSGAAKEDTGFAPELGPATEPAKPEAAEIAEPRFTQTPQQ